jgi:hypothetical protein
MSDIKEGYGIHSISRIKRSELTKCADFSEEILALNTHEIPVNPNTWYIFTIDNPIRGVLEDLPLVLRQAPRANTLFRIPVCQDEDPGLYQDDIIGFPTTDINANNGNFDNCCEFTRREDFYVPIQLAATFNAAAGNIANGLDITQRVDDVYAIVLYLNNMGTFTLTRVLSACEYHARLRREACVNFPEVGINALGTNGRRFNWQSGRNGFGNDLFGCGNKQRVQINTIR